MATRHDTPRRVRSAAAARSAAQQQLSLPGLAPLTDLPFIKDVKVNADQARRCYWKVRPPTGNALNDRIEGGAYAFFFVNHLNDNPCCAGQDVLARIIVDMASAKHGVRSGYVQGFLGMLQHMIMRKSAVLDQINPAAERQVARTARIKAPRRRRVSVASVSAVAP